MMLTLREIVEDTGEPDLLGESRKKDHRILLNDREIDFGSDLHIVDLKRTLAGLERIRDCYHKGSGARLVFASASQRIRGLIDKLSPNIEKKTV